MSCVIWIFAGCKFNFFSFLAWLGKAIAVIQKATIAKSFTKKRVKVRSTICHYATKRPAKIKMHLGLDIIIKLKFRTTFDRCLILNVLNCLTKNFEH